MTAREMTIETTETSQRISGLLSKMIDLKQLAVKPDPQEQSGTFSSYDRRSRYDQASQTYQDWGANEDSDGCIRQENGEEVVVELTGPGVIWRIWSAQPEDGCINFYFDGEQKPSYSRPFKKMFEQISDDVSPAGFPSLMPKLSGGYNSFFPIPFQKSLKITFSKGWGKYYHFTYTKFPKTACLPSFSELLSKEGLQAIAVLDRQLYARGDAYEQQCCKNRPVLKAGSQILLEAKGPGALTYLGFDLYQEHYSAAELEWLLRSILLNIYWDQQEQPAVSVPLGDFCGSSPGYHLLKTLAVGVTEKRLYCNWYMPYSAGVKVEIINESGRELPMEFAYRQEGLSTETAEELLRFHAKWHTGDFQQLEPSTFAVGGERWPDWPILLTQGAGRFCGMQLHVLDRWAAPLESSEMWWYGLGDKKTIDWWWGEGDEKFFVDGEKFPSTFGTGSEDYVGYAWAAEPPFALFDSAYAAQPLMAIDGNGHTSVLRLQICDNVPFHTGFEGFIEKYKADNWGADNCCLYEVTPYWYQEKSNGDAYQSPSLASRQRTLR